MGIFYVQHWINTVELLTAVEQACLFLKEIEKMGSFMCWIAEVILLICYSLTSDTIVVLLLHWQCCWSQMTILLLEGDRWSSAARNTCRWQAEEGCTWGEEGTPQLRSVCVVVPLLHNGSAALPAAEPGDSSARSPRRDCASCDAGRQQLPSMPCT